MSYKPTHTFHIPVMGLAYTIDSPIRVGQFGISSVVSITDDELIEKEWVDKAKQIIEQTRDDPHARTAQVNALQRDYLQKRYGKVVGTSD